MVDTLAKQLDEMEAEFSVRLGILHNMLDEGFENILDQLGERGAPAPKKPGGGSPDDDGSTPSGEGHDDDEPEGEAVERSVLRLESFLGKQA